MNTTKRTRRNVAIFSLVAIVCGWVGVGIDSLLAQPSNLESLGALVFIATPLLCTIILRFWGGDGWKDFPIRLNFKENTRWYLFALLVYPVVIGATMLIGHLLGWTDVSRFSPAAYLPVLAAAFLPEFVKNIFEESVWRGYLTVKMAQLTKNEWIIYLVVGLVWQIWHLPYYLILLDDAYLAKFFPYGEAWFVFSGFFVIGVWTIMYTELFLLSRSLWLVVLMHTIEDALNPLISEGFINIPIEYNWLISPSFGMIPLAIYLGIGLWLRKVRKKKEVSESLHSV